MANDTLDSLAERYPDCLIVAFADIAVGITLRTAEATDVPREAVDELCTEAKLSFAAAGPESPLVIKSLENALFVFMRVPQEADDALLVMCRDSIDMDAFLNDARAFMGLAA